MSVPEDLISAAKDALDHAYAPYSNFRVGAALRFEDGAVITGSNVENASYGLSLCAETVAVAKALAGGRRGGLIEVAVAASGPDVVTPCGRCRQVLHELAAVGNTDPLVWCTGPDAARAIRLSTLLPEAFGPDSL